VSPGFKFNHWEIRGVPIRIEIGFKDLEKREVCVVRRDTKEKRQVTEDNCVDEICGLMEEMNRSLFERAKKKRDEKIKEAEDFASFEKFLDGGNMVLCPWCDRAQCEDEIGERTKVVTEGEVVVTGAKTLCLPFEAPSFEGKKCVRCNEPAKCYALFGRSY